MDLGVWEGVEDMVRAVQRFFGGLFRYGLPGLGFLEFELVLVCSMER